MVVQEQGEQSSRPHLEPDVDWEGEFRRYQRAVKIMARQQLDVSEDSPFNRHQPLEWAQLKTEQDERARQLREETEEIKRQLELVKSRMGELSLAREESGLSSAANEPSQREGKKEQSSNTNQDQEEIFAGRHATNNERTETSRRDPQVADQQATSVDNQFHRSYGSSLNLVGETESSKQQEPHQTSQQKPPTDDQAKLRPLTGKTDCPNCACDKRRRSVCDTCCQLQQIVVQHQSIAPPHDDSSVTTNPRQSSFLISKQRQQTNDGFIQQDSTKTGTNTAIKSPNANSNSYIDYDERPIRPAKPTANVEQNHDESPTKLRARVEVVDKVVVPNKLYTIGKALDDKRTKLAQAIEDLQLMMDRVRKRGDRLDQERKVAQLYRDQWKFGPAIGGGSGGVKADCSTKANKIESRARPPQYQSRLDPNLARDTNSLMGFQHVEPQMKLRQYGGGVSRLGQRTPALAPQPKPRRSKMTKTLVQGTPIGARRSNTATTGVARANTHHTRSRSLESLPARPIRRMMTATVGLAHKTALKLTKVINHSEPGLDDTNFQQGKSSSELNLASGAPSDEGDAIEEEIEEEIVSVNGDKDNGADDGKGNNQSTSDSGAKRDGGSVDGEKSGGNGDSDNDDHDEGNYRTQRNSRANEEPERTQSGENDRVKKMTWVPVFGETEIKTVQRRQPTRKLVVLNDGDGDGDQSRCETRTAGGLKQQQQQALTTTRLPGSILRQPHSTSGGGCTRATPVRQRSYSAVTQAASRGTGRQQHGRDLVMNEAAKKLHFAEDLLDREERDSRTRNQVVITDSRYRLGSRVGSRLSANPSSVVNGVLGRRQQPSPEYVQLASGQRQRRASSQDRAPETPKQAPTQVAQDLILGANREISRLEEMISDQQRLLLRLANTQQASASTDPHCVCPRQSRRSRHSSPCSCLALRQTHSKSHIGPATVAGEAAGSGSSSRQLIAHLRDRLNKTRARLAKTLEEERAKHHRLEQKVDSSLRKQSDLANENELLKRSLSKCIDTCLRDIASTFESLSDTLADSMVSLDNHSDTNSESALDGLGTASANASAAASPARQLTNAAQLISDNRHLKRMRSHIETIERQRRGIFEELSNEKVKSQQLEMELRQNKQELDQLVAAKRKLEAQLATTTGNPSSGFSPGEGFSQEHLSQPSTIGEMNKTRDSTSPTVFSQPVQQTPPPTQRALSSCQPRPSTSKQAVCDMATSSSDYESNQTDRSAADELSSNTLNSIDMYRHYIQSITPDLDAIRRERRLILDEFDNIKKMLSEMDN